MSGPSHGPQPEVKSCPICQGELKNIPSASKPVPFSHRYECLKCNRSFEINVWND